MSNNFFSFVNRFVRFDTVRAEDVNDAFDLVVSGFDGVEVKTDASIKLPDGETAVALGNAAARMGKVLGFNATTGAPEATVTYDEISSAQTHATNALASQNAAAASQLAAANSETAAHNSEVAAALSAAAASSAALNNLTARSYFLFTM